MLTSKEATRIMQDARETERLEQRLDYEIKHELLLEEVNRQVLAAANEGRSGVTLEGICISNNDWDELETYLIKYMGYTTSWYCYYKRERLHLEWGFDKDKEEDYERRYCTED